MPIPDTAHDLDPGHIADHNVINAELAALEAADQGTVTTGSLMWNVKDYGVTGNGSTDDTAAAQAVIDNASAVGGVVFFPPGTYDLNNVQWKANVRYLGIRGKSILRIRTGAAYLGSCDSGSPTAFISNMHFEGLTFRGRIDTDTTFDQQRHLLNLNGIADCTITNCEFIGWHGDAIYLGSSNSGGTERHNQRVTISRCFFDGLTKNNRNCVSIIDGEMIQIVNNVARRFSRGDMPGFVDVEPNSANSTFAVCRKILVSGNITSDHNQNFFQLNLPSASYTNEVRDILVSNNIDDADPAAVGNTNTRFAFLLYGRSVTGASSTQNILITENLVRNVYCILEIEGGIVGAELSGNRFEDCAGALIIGYWNATTRHLRIERNNFTRCGVTDGNVIRIEYANNVVIGWNKFHACAANIVAFSLGESSIGSSTMIDYISNQITGTTTTSVSSKHASHTLVASGNLKRGYRENGLTIDPAHFGVTV